MRSTRTTLILVSHQRTFSPPDIETSFEFQSPDSDSSASQCGCAAITQSKWKCCGNIQEASYETWDKNALLTVSRK